MIARCAWIIGASLSYGVLVACSPGATTAPPITQVNPGDPHYSKLQLAVGTANIYGTSIGLNVVSTLRQPDGRSAIGASTPQLTGPFSFAAAPGPAPAAGTIGLADPYTTIPNGGPSLPETTTMPPAITGTPQTVQLGTPYCDTGGSPPSSGFTVCPPGIKPNATSFGQSGSVFATGLAPFNSVGSTGQSYSYAPYAQPLYDFGGTHTPFVPWGGPPAFDPDGNGMGTRDGLVPLGSDSFNLPYFLGVGEGLTAFEGVVPRSGPYQLAVQIGVASQSGGNTIFTIATSASMSAGRKLPNVTAPMLTQDATGGATFTLTLPSGISEALVQVVDFGPGAMPPSAPGTMVCSPSSSSGCPPTLASNCQGPKGTAFAPVYYTVEVTHAGAYSLASNHGPNINPNGGRSHLTPSPTLCTAAQNKAAGFANIPDAFSVQVIGFDYPAYEMAKSLEGNSPPQTPQIAGPGGQSDVTISAPIVQNCGKTPPSVKGNPDCVTISDRLVPRKLIPRPLAPRTFGRPSVVPAFTGVPPAQHDDRFRR